MQRRVRLAVPPAVENQANTPRLTLAIEIANPGSGVGGGVTIGVVHPGDPARSKPLAVETLREVDRDRDDLIPAIERLLLKSGHIAGDLQQIAVSIGPGGFTSTRVACATGAMLAEGLKIPVVPVPSALVGVMHWRHQSGTTQSPEPVAVLLAAKGNAAWCAVVPGVATPVETAAAARNGQMRTAENLPTDRLSAALADSHLPPSIRTAFTDSRVLVQPLVFSAPACLAAAALCESSDPSTLVPIYPREPEAVTLWRLRHGPKTTPNP